jgi:hypothetical protein
LARTSDSVLLAALHDELDASPTIRLGVPGTELLRRTIDDNVDLAKQLIQRSSHPQASLLHGSDMLLGRAKQTQAFVRDNAHAPVDSNVRYADEAHVALQSNRICNAFADHPVPVDGNPNFSLRPW